MAKKYKVGTLFAVKKLDIGYDFVAEVTEIINATMDGHAVLDIHYKILHGQHPTEQTDFYSFHVNSFFDDLVVILPNTGKVLYGVKV